MSDHLDPLEQELASLKPREPSADLRRSMERRLKREWRVIWVTAFVAGLVSGLIYLLFVWNTQVEDPRARSTDQSLPPIRVTVPDESQPTWQAYRRAISRSPEELEALLDKQATASAGGESKSMSAFSRPEFVSIGEP